MCNLSLLWNIVSDWNSHVYTRVTSVLSSIDSDWNHKWNLLGENEVAVGILLVGVSKPGYFSRNAVWTFTYHFGHRLRCFWTVGTGLWWLCHETKPVYLKLCKLIWNFNKCVSVFWSIQCNNARGCVGFSFVGVNTWEKSAGLYLSMHVLNSL